MQKEAELKFTNGDYVLNYTSGLLEVEVFMQMSTLVTQQTSLPERCSWVLPGRVLASKVLPFAPSRSAWQQPLHSSEMPF